VTVPLGVVPLVLVLLATGASRADDGWKLALERDGIRVEQKAVEGRGLPMFRATARIPAPFDAVLGVILDVESQPEWMPRCEEIRVLERGEPHRAVFYVRMGMPWPVSDRDAVLESETLRPEAGRSLTSFRLTEREEAPPLSGIVRMPALEGHYALRSIDPTTTEVEYQVDADPGGLIPGWLAARTATEDPIETLRNLRGRATGRPLP
jgi:hypothetical protein